MPIFNLEIRVDDKGVVQGARNLGDLSRSADGARRSVNELSRASGEAGRSMTSAFRNGLNAIDNQKSAIEGTIKQVLALVGAYKAVGEAAAFINRGISFNNAFEQSQIGIASLITSMVKLEDAQGRALEGAEKYAAAQGVAKDLMQEIQKLGLETTATSESLVEGVQSIMGPALQAGMALKDIPKFAVAGAQAMQTLGIPLNQMRTELDALLTGSVNKTQDILAPKLFADIKGDLGEYIRSLKESGTLIDEIFKRLQPFQQAGADVANTWEGLTSNLSEAIDTLAGQASRPLLDNLKKSVAEIQGLLVDEKSETVGISENFQQIQRVLTEIEATIGEGILSATRTLIDYAKRFNEYLGGSESTSDFETLAAAIKLVSAALIGVAGARAAAFGKGVISNAVTQAKNEIDKYRASVINAAKAQIESIKAEQARIEAYAMSENGQRRLMQNESARMNLLMRQTELTNQLTAAQTRLNQVQNMGAGRGALGAIGSGFSKLINLLGGPFNVAVMGAITGVSLLAMKQSEAERAADLHGRALSTLNELTKQAADSNKDLTDWLGNVAEARRNMAIEQATEAMRGFANEIKLLDFRSADYDNETGFRNQAEALNEMAEAVRTGQMEFSAFSDELAIVYNDMYKQGQASTELGKRIKEALDLARQGADAEEIIKRLTKAYEEGAKAAQESGKAQVAANDDATKSINSMAEELKKYDDKQKANVSTLSGALQWLDKRNASTEIGKKHTEDLAKVTDLMAMATLNAAIYQAQFNAEAAQEIMLQGNLTDAKIAEANRAWDLVSQLEGARARILEGQKDPNYGKSGGGSGGGKKAGGGKSGVDEYTKAAEKWEDLRDKLAQLQGKSDGTAASLKKTLKEIEDTGKAAKKSAGEIESLKQAFIDASDTKTMRELNKELFQLEGNTRAVRDIENKEKVDNYKAKLESVQKLNAAQKEALLGRYEAAVVNATDKENIETRLNFYKELADLSGNYGASIDYQNQLIDKQAKEWELAGIPLKDIEERVRLMKEEIARDPFSGMVKGLRKYSDEATNLASQIGDVVGDTFSSMEDAFVQFVQTGKASFTDLANSIISDLMRITVRSTITGPIASALGNAFGDFFSGGASVSEMASVATSGANEAMAYVYHSGGMVGPNHPADRAMPLFAFSDAPRFHKGGGLFRYDEYPAILQAGERVLNQDETRAYNAGIASAGLRSDNSGYLQAISDLQAQMRQERQYNPGNMPIVNVNIENNSNAQVQAGQMRRDGQGNFTMDIIVSQFEQAMVGRAKQGKSQLAKYNETTYGFNRASVIARSRGRN